MKVGRPRPPRRFLRATEQRVFETVTKRIRPGGLPPLWVLISVAALAIAPGTARAQRGPAPPIVGGGQINAAAPPTTIARPSLPPRPVVGPAPVRVVPFRLRTVIIEGDHALSAAALTPAWQSYLGHVVTSRDVTAILTAIGEMYHRRSGLALYSAALPPQDFAGGTLRIRVVEGHVAAITIAGNTKGADLSLLRAYAQRIAADRPLRQAVLERNILLMQAIPGLKVGSTLQPMAGEPGAVRLVLGVQRKPLEAGFGINNLGNSTLDIVQATANVTANGLFREGEQDQFVFGFPATLRRYQYYGYSHLEPIGDNGMTLSFAIGDLVTHPTGAANSGSAQIASLRLDDPVIDTLTRRLVLSAQADYLNSSEALLGQTTSDERTRALRLNASYVRAGDWNGLDRIEFRASEGIDAFGARLGSVASGGPSFSKLNLGLARLQQLPGSFLLTLLFSGQYAFQRLPVSEEFLFGGPEYGRGYATATMEGDSGIAVSGELSHKLGQPPGIPKALFSGLTAFAYADWGRVWNHATPYAFATDSAASAGMGLRFALLDRVTLSLGAATQLAKPKEEAKLEVWRFLFEISAHL